MISGAIDTEKIVKDKITEALMNVSQELKEKTFNNVLEKLMIKEFEGVSEELKEGVLASSLERLKTEAMRIVTEEIKFNPTNLFFMIKPCNEEFKFNCYVWQTKGDDIRTSTFVRKIEIKEILGG